MSPRFSCSLIVAQTFVIGFFSCQSYVEPNGRTIQSVSLVENQVKSSKKSKKTMLLQIKKNCGKAKSCDGYDS